MFEADASARTLRTIVCLLPAAQVATPSTCRKPDFQGTAVVHAGWNFIGYVVFYIDDGNCSLRGERAMRNINILIVITTVGMFSMFGTRSGGHCRPKSPSAYDASLAAMQSSKSPQDINRMVEAMDSPDWVGVAPTGEKTSRDQAEKQLLWAFIDTGGSETDTPTKNHLCERIWTTHSSSIGFIENYR